MASVNEIRSHFLDYFSRNGHRAVSSSPLVPHNDPTLMFTNAGMVQFKNVFTGVEFRDYSRAATSQKCVRAGGKHNDLDNVGYTARHHTFFEMLGNFSFGDYFKADAIELAWNLITREFGLPTEKLLVTVFSEDEDAAMLWRKVAGLSDDRIIRISTSDNFWAMGDTGPCGPCSEIFFDHGDHIPGGPPGSLDEDGDRFIEIWNLVFMQYEQVSPDKRINLPKPSIDTGMGLERIAAILQGKRNNYDIDLFRRLIEASVEYSGASEEGERAASHKVIADHLRAASFLISDGVTPSNEGRGYVLRRIMRRAMRHAQLMGCNEPLLWRLVPTLVSEMGQPYPELVRAQALVTETLRLEESRFKRTLSRGLRLLDDAVSGLADGADLAGDVAFQLYDTYGFPLDLTQDALRSHGRGVDVAAFDVAMEKQRADARRNWAGSGETATDEVWFSINEEHGASEFLGYELGSAEGVILAIVDNGSVTDEAETGSEVSIVVNQSPFYGESGGQMGDTGLISSADGARALVTDTQKQVGDLLVHRATVEVGCLRVGDAVNLEIDHIRRLALQSNHSATHLLHAALRRRLGEHVTQKGSLVAPDRLRFDISHPKAVTVDELNDVEAEVNDQIRANKPLMTRIMTHEDAVNVGAVALFGEKYGDEVRVVSMGEGDAGVVDNPYSVELCGGVHVGRTGEIGLFRVVAEQATAAGVRRIEGLTGEAARIHVAQQEALLQSAATMLKSSLADVPDRIAALLEERKRLEREVSDLHRRIATGDGGDAEAEVRNIEGVPFVARQLDGVAPKELRGLVDAVKKQTGSGIFALVTVAEGKVALAVGVSNDLTDRFSAVDLVRAGASAVGGKGGGGRADMAQAGGPDGANAGNALVAIEKIVAETAKA